MPIVREPSGEAPVKLEVVEVRPGVRLKLSPADKEAILGHQAAADEQRRAWNLINAGVEDEPAPKKSSGKTSAGSAKAKTAGSSTAATAAASDEDDDDE